MKTQLNALAAALSVGLLWGLGMLVCTVAALQWGYADEFMELMGDVYPGYDVSGTGVIVGFIYGFLDGFIGTWILVSVYNFFVRKLSK